MLGVISQDIVGEDITNVSSNSNKTSKTFTGRGQEVLGVGLVEDRLPPVKLEKFGNTWEDDLWPLPLGSVTNSITNAIYRGPTKKRTKKFVVRLIRQNGLRFINSDMFIKKTEATRKVIIMGHRGIIGWLKWLAIMTSNMQGGRGNSSHGQSLSIMRDLREHHGSS